MVHEPVGVELNGTSQTEWTVLAGREWARLDRFLEVEKELSQSARDKIFATAVQILARCPDPKEPRGGATGLALGKVQSGKTSQFIALIALAIDNGYRNIIVFGGRNNGLLGQNNERLEEYFSLSQRSDVICPFVNPTADDCEEIHAILEGGGTILISVLKDQRRIGPLKALFGHPDLTHYPTLIIDDEGDQASPNTRVAKGEKSTIYDKILNLRSALKHFAYVAFTATPQANLLMKQWDDLRPQFCVLIEPGEGYCGGSTWFVTERTKLLRKVADNEDPEEEMGIPQGLETALATFWVGAVIRILRHDDRPHAMLIHTSGRRGSHESVRQKVAVLQDFWRTSLSLPKTDPGYKDIAAILKRSYDDLASTVEGCLGWEEVVIELQKEIKRTKIWMVNSLPKGHNPTTTPRRLKNNIMIGGNMLDRGVTIDGLAVAYITRTSKEQQADTVEQRARWFGYKRKHLDVCRLYGTQQIFEVFTELVDHEDNFWNSLRRNEQQGLPLSEWPVMFKLDLNLKPTRGSVGTVRSYKGTGWTVETRLNLDPSVCEDNLQVVDEFFKSREKQNFWNQHWLVRTENPQEVIDDLLTKLTFTPDSNWDHPYATEYLQRLMLAGRIKEMDVVLMSKGTHRFRTPDSGTVQIFAGRTSVYPGDRYLHGNRVHLQVHVIQHGDKGPVTTALALHIPDDSQYDLGRHVIPS